MLKIDDVKLHFWTISAATGVAESLDKTRDELLILAGQMISKDPQHAKDILEDCETLKDRVEYIREQIRDGE
jgi:anti-sigma28 factor (negative regulator of flagellin synthesis)